jgi:Mg2+-importing ATPase
MRTFANTLKYVFMATSTNFGNMFSMVLSPEMTKSIDNVDPEIVGRPRK